MVAPVSVFFVVVAAGPLLFSAAPAAVSAAAFAAGTASLYNGAAAGGGGGGLKEESPPPREASSSPPLPPFGVASGRSTTKIRQQRPPRQQHQLQRQRDDGTSSGGRSAAREQQQRRRGKGGGEGRRGGGGSVASAAAARARDLPESIPRLSDVLLGECGDVSVGAAAVSAPNANAVAESPPSAAANDSASKDGKEKSAEARTTRSKTPPPGSRSRQSQSREPWRAGYYTSVKTQRRIKDAANVDARTSSSPSSSSSASASAGAVRVLRTFLDTPPERCNPANLVCALTLSAKLVGGSRSDHRASSSSSSSKTNANEELRTLLFRSVDVLGEMVERKLLSARQLCNAAWAIAKHCDRDDRILPSRGGGGAGEKGKAVTVAVPGRDGVGAHFGLEETWDLTTSSCLAEEESPSHRASRVVDMVALELASLLEEDDGEDGGDGKRKVAKVGELCMAGWAYGVLRPRQHPPGWKSGPRLALATRRRRHSRRSQARDPDVVRFETWTSSSSSSSALGDGGKSNRNRAADLNPPSETDVLFDAIARSLLLPSRSSRDGEATAAPVETATAAAVTECDWKELANLAWAFASHGRSSSLEAQDLMSAIGGEVAARLRRPGAIRSVLSRDVAQVVWSLGILQTDTFQVAGAFLQVVDALVAANRVDVVDNNVSRPFASWSCADIVQVALSLAHARLDETGLLRSLYDEANRRLAGSLGSVAARGGTADDEGRARIPSFRAWEVSILLWAQARLYLKEQEGPVFGEFTGNAVAYIAELSRGRSSLSDLGIGSQEQANLAWSLTILEEYDDPNVASMLSRIFEEASDACKREGYIHLEHAHQLWQALFLLEHDFPQSVSTVPEWFYKYLREKWLVEKARVKISSARHRSLSQTLDLMGVAHTNEHDEDIDVAIVLKPKASWTHETTRASTEEGVKLAVEFDGPNHFTRIRTTPDGSKPPAPRALGHTVLKYRILKKQGWSVVRVPYYEFDKIPFWASMERQRYLQRLLKTHGNLRFSEIDISEYKAPVHDRRSRFD